MNAEMIFFPPLPLPCGGSGSESGFPTKDDDDDDDEDQHDPQLRSMGGRGSLKCRVYY